MAVVDQKGRDFLSSEREDRLQAYGHTPQDINAHYSDEGQIQADYHKRFAFELIQNADDAMVDVDREKTVRFEVRDGVLLVANTGRAINEDDVTALCTMSHTTKGLQEEQRASIGHKGRGFSSVLEITDRPQVYSSGISFEFDRGRSREPIRKVVEEDEDWTFDQIDGIPLMRLPFPPEEVPNRVVELLNEGYNTVFRFPLKDDKVEADVVETISGLDRNTVLFLHELERLEINVEGRRDEGWDIEREEKGIDSDETDLKFVSVRHIGSSGASDNKARFALFSRDKVEIGSHTGGIDENTWGDVKFTQLGLALRVDEREDGIHLTRLEEKPFFHVFLPTEEWCPIPVLVNGAFHTAISRTSINVTEDEDNYNGFLLGQVAELLATDVLDYVEGTATEVEEFIDCLDFTDVSTDNLERDLLKQRFISSIKSELEDVEFVPRLEKLQTGEILSDPGYASLSETVVPFYSHQQPKIAEVIARVYGNDLVDVEDLEASGWFPKTTLLEPNRAAILEGLGARKLHPDEVPVVLGAVPDEASPLYRYPEPEDELAVDPVLQVLIWIWKTISGRDEVVGDFKDACRASAVFPVGQLEEGVVLHVAKGDAAFYLPPRRELPDIQLSGIRFLTPPVYRPEVRVNPERQSELVEELKPALEAIWDVKEFNFEEVVQDGVFPKLPSPQNPDADDSELRNIRVLDLLRRLAEESVNPDKPLPYIERDGTLHRLCLLPVPTRDGEWQRAYQVYFGEDWQPESDDVGRGENLFEAAGVGQADYLTGPDALPGSVEFDPEEESLYDEWKRFFRWLGVSPHIRLKPFFDPREQRRFKETNGIERPDQGSLLARLNEDEWSEYQEHLRTALNTSGNQLKEYNKIYQLQGIEYFGQLVRAANIDNQVAERLFKHIAEWWNEGLRRFEHPLLATSDQSSWRRRNQNCPYEREKRSVGLNLWLWQLKKYSWCPSNQGRVNPEDVWLPTENVRQRFEIHDVVLLPVLSEDVLDAASEARDLMHTLGVRHEVTRTNFQPSDAAVIARTVAEMFRGEDDEVVARSLRQIKPAYRYLSELLPALDRATRNISDEDWQDAREDLSEIDVLARQGTDDFVFEPAQETYFVRSPDVLDRIPIEGIPVFVLQEDEAVRFGTYYGMKDLEGEAEADPSFIDDGEADEKTEELVEFLEEVAPFILCRLEAERPSQELIDQDINGMRSFLNELAIVDDIEVEYKFGGGPEATVIPSNPDFFLDRRGRGRTERPLPFVKNADEEEEQNRLLARALCEFLEVSQFEGVITLLNAETDARRLEYLKMAGAPSSLDEVEGKRQDLFEGDRGRLDFEFEFDRDGEDVDLDEVEEDESAVERELRRRREQETRDHPVYDAGELQIQGETITVLEEASGEGSGGGGGEPGEAGQGGAVSVSQEYRSRVDKLGMSISLQFERERLREEYFCEDPENYVFDVHNEDLIADAQADDVAGDVLEWLEAEAGLPLPFPGFDILTVNPESGEADRLIELKSSGHDLRTPSVTWNEWKTASTSTVQDLYYLYIAGNLRKDIQSEPYLREIPNPFAVLNTETEEMVKKEVKVRVTDFKKDTHVRETHLTVQASD